MTQRDTVIADFQRSRSGAIRVRFYMVVGIFLFMLFAALIIAAWPVITVVAFYLAIGLAIALGLAVVIGFCALVFMFYQWTRRERAKTRKMEHEADLSTHPRDHVAYRWENRRLIPVYEPRQALLAPPIEAVEAGPLDFLTVMTQPRRVFAIIADQQTGKTTLCHHLAEWWMQRGIKPVVIGQKFDSGEYRNCERYGPDTASILAGLEAIRQEANYRQRLANEGQPFSEMELQPVFLEDFTNMTSIMDRAELERFVAQALTVYAARGLLLYFVAHSRSKEAFGLTRQGASLKDQMTRLEIIAAYDNNGNVDHSRKQTVCSIGSGGEPVPVTGIPGYRPNLDRDCRLALYSLAIPVAERVIDPQEKTILSMYDAGANISTIAAAVYGSKGGPQNGRVKEVLSRNSEI